MSSLKQNTESSLLLSLIVADDSFSLGAHELLLSWTVAGGDVLQAHNLFPGASSTSCSSSPLLTVYLSASVDFSLVTGVLLYKL